MSDGRQFEQEIATVSRSKLLNKPEVQRPFFIHESQAERWLEAIVRLYARCAAYKQALCDRQIPVPQIDERPAKEIADEYTAKMRSEYPGLRDMGFV